VAGLVGDEGEDLFGHGWCLRLFVAGEHQLLSRSGFEAAESLGRLADQLALDPGHHLAVVVGGTARLAGIHQLGAADGPFAGGDGADRVLLERLADFAAHGGFSVLLWQSRVTG